MYLAQNVPKRCISIREEFRLGEKMKWSPGALFCEQVGELTRLFSQWNECEQTVVLFALLRRIPAPQAKFLAQAVQHSLHSVSELDTQEINANNPGNCDDYILHSLYAT